MDISPPIIVSLVYKLLDSFDNVTACKKNQAISMTLMVFYDSVPYDMTKMHHDVPSQSIPNLASPRYVNLPLAKSILNQYKLGSIYIAIRSGSSGSNKYPVSGVTARAQFSSSLAQEKPYPLHHHFQK